MVRIACRAALFLGVVLALWTFSRPARAASAPLCDDRGATVLAHPPPLEVPDIAIERIRVLSSCPVPWDSDGNSPLCRRILPGRQAAALRWSAPEPAVPLVLAPLPPPDQADAEPPPEQPRTGRRVHARVERPPRA
jgi:hypothetical protein